MFQLTAPITLRLQRNDVLALRPTQAARLHVACGVVWATRAGDHEDHFLHAGDTLDLPRGRSATLSAEATASLRLEDGACAPASRVTRSCQTTGGSAFHSSSS